MGNIIRVTVIRPRQRPYRTNNFYAVLQRQEISTRRCTHIVYGNQTLAASAVPETEKKPVQPVKTKKKLSRADRKQIEAAIARANRTDKRKNRHRTVSLMNECGRTGICRVSDSHYTKNHSVSRTSSYQLSQNEDKTAIFEGLV